MGPLKLLSRRGKTSWELSSFSPGREAIRAWEATIGSIGIEIVFRMFVQWRVGGSEALLFSATLSGHFSSFVHSTAQHTQTGQRYVSGIIRSITVLISMVEAIWFIAHSNVTWDMTKYVVAWATLWAVSQTWIDGNAFNYNWEYWNDIFTGLFISHRHFIGWSNDFIRSCGCPFSQSMIHVDRIYWKMSLTLMSFSRWWLFFSQLWDF